MWREKCALRQVVAPLRIVAIAVAAVAVATAVAGGARSCRARHLSARQACAGVAGELRAQLVAMCAAN